METTGGHINDEFIDLCNCDLLVAGNFLFRVECDIEKSMTNAQQTLKLYSTQHVQDCSING